MIYRPTNVVLHFIKINAYLTRYNKYESKGVSVTFSYRYHDIQVVLCKFLITNL